MAQCCVLHIFFNRKYFVLVRGDLAEKIFHRGYITEKRLRTTALDDVWGIWFSLNPVSVAEQWIYLFSPLSQYIRQILDLNELKCAACRKSNLNTLFIYFLSLHHPPQCSAVEAHLPPHLGLSVEADCPINLSLLQNALTQSEIIHQLDGKQLYCLGTAITVDILFSDEKCVITLNQSLTYFVVVKASFSLTPCKTLFCVCWGVIYHT